eukprot:366103-Chlamydomonas_euryale.AAC.6
MGKGRDVAGYGKQQGNGKTDRDRAEGRATLRSRFHLGRGGRNPGKLHTFPNFSGSCIFIGRDFLAPKRCIPVCGKLGSESNKRAPLRLGDSCASAAEARARAGARIIHSQGHGEGLETPNERTEDAAAALLAVAAAARHTLGDTLP